MKNFWVKTEETIATLERKDEDDFVEDSDLKIRHEREFVLSMKLS